MKIKLLVSTFTFLLAFSACKKDETTVPPIDNNPPTANFTVKKTGTFVKANGYSTSGTAQLGTDEKGENIVRLKDDFKTTFATGSVTIYLSKNQNLKLADAASFINLAVINTNGLHDFKLSAAPTDDFNFVISWCAPAGIQFGMAELK